MMRVLLVDADSQKDFPNLALMKLSAYHKAQGHDVDLIKGIPDAPPLVWYDKCYVSVLYFQNRDKALDIAFQLPNCTIGGTGWDLETTLDPEIEFMMPDYSLYDIDYSMGFTSRGCIRSCPWCVVPEKEGLTRDNMHVSEFMHPDHKKVVILDNNFLASPRCRENFEYLIENKIRVNFNSGLDIRLIDEEIAKLIKETKIRDWKFKTTKYTFAYDLPKHKESVRKGIEILRDAGVNLHRDNCIFYVLVGYNTTPTQDLERVYWLKNQGVGPYIMRYNQVKGPDRILLHMSRWVNRKLYQFMDFADYDYSDSQECYSTHFKGDRPQRVWSKG
jgi:hypothetical protein